MALAICLVLWGQQGRSLETASGAAREHQGAPMLSVDFRDGLLSVRARQGSWMNVLNEVSRKTGILFHRSTRLEGSVSLSFKDLPLKQALERLFGPEADFVFLHPRGALRPRVVPQQVWVLGTVWGGGSEAPQTTGDSDRAELGSKAIEPSASQDRGIEGRNGKGEAVAAEDAQGSLDLADPHVIDHLVEMTGNEDPVTRVWALSNLVSSGPENEGVVELALDLALTDQDASVRGYAVQALASRRGPEAMEHLWHAVQDPDPGVRMRAIDSVAPSNGQGIALLQETLSDVDETVRSLAAFRLKQGMNDTGG